MIGINVLWDNAQKSYKKIENIIDTNAICQKR